MWVNLAAIIFFILSLVVVMFQWLLFMKKPYGEYTMGGQFKGVLPTPYRIAALIQSFVLLFNGFVVLDYHHSILFPHVFLVRYIWFVLGLMLISMVMNLITKSQKERRLWGPITVIMFMLVVLVWVS